MQLYYIELDVHRCGSGGSVRACHAAGPGSNPGRDKFPGWGFSGFFPTCKCREYLGPKVPEYHLIIIINDYGRQWPEMLTRPKASNIHTCTWSVFIHSIRAEISYTSALAAVFLHLRASVPRVSTSQSKLVAVTAVDTETHIPTHKQTSLSFIFQSKTLVIVKLYHNSILRATQQVVISFRFTLCIN